MFSESFYSGRKTHELLTEIWRFLGEFEKGVKEKSLQNQRFAGFRLFLTFNLAEREGFEPPDLLQSTVFKTAAFDRSAISPAQI